MSEYFQIEKVFNSNNQVNIIEASAGTGKTFALTSMIHEILNTDKKCSPSNILVLSFSKAAKNELISRINNAGKSNSINRHDHILHVIYDHAMDINIYTFHQFANNILNSSTFSSSNTTTLDNTIIRSIINIVFNSINIIESLVLIQKNENLFTIRRLLKAFLYKKYAYLLPQNYSVLLLLSKFCLEHLANTSMFIPQSTYDLLYNLFIQQHLSTTIQEPTEWWKELSLSAFLQHCSINFNINATKSNLTHLQDAICNHIWPLTQQFCNNHKLPIRLWGLLLYIQISTKKILADYGMMGYDDSIIHAKSILESTPELINLYQQKYKYILIDEMQDTDEVQWDIINLLLQNPNKTSDTPTLFMFGDTKQTIYQFRGINTYNINKSKQKLTQNKKTGVFALTTNYRATPNMIEAINWMFAHVYLPNNNSISFAPIVHSPTPLEKNEIAIYWITVKNKKDIAHHIATTLQELTNTKKHICIICRTNQEIINIANCLQEHNIFVYLINTNLIISLLAFIFANVNSYVSCSINKSTINSIILSPIFCIDTNIYKSISQDVCAKFTNMIYEFIYETKNRGLGKALYTLLNNPHPCFSGYSIQEVATQKYGSLFEEIESIFAHPICNIINASLQEIKVMLEELLFFPEHIDLPNKGNKISIKTVHAVKGMEFDIVFNTATTAKHTGGSLTSAMQLLYVSCTRAKEVMFLYDYQQISNTTIVNLWEKYHTPPITAPKQQQIEYVDINELNHKRSEYLNRFLNNLPKQKKDHIIEPYPTSNSPVSTIPQTYSFSSYSHEQKDENFLQNILNKNTLSVSPINILSGKLLGTLTHKVLEITEITLDKQILNTFICSAFTLSSCASYLSEDNISLVQTMVIRAFSKPIFDGKALTEIKHFVPIIRESDFAFLEDKKIFIGKIDLLTQYNGIIYIIDWKTDQIDTNLETVEQIVTTKYSKQAKIYSSAIKLANGHQQKILSKYVFLKCSNLHDGVYEFTTS